MRTHFAQIFWGLLLVILDLNINGFDFLVDGLGYIIIAAGCSGLSVLSPRFASAQILSIVLLVLWLLGFAIQDQGVMATIYGITTTLVNCMMIWQLLGGVSEYSYDQQRPDLVRLAEKRRIAYVAIMVGTYLIGFIANDIRAAWPLIIVLLGLGIIIIVLILHLIHRVKNEIAT